MQNRFRDKSLRLPNWDYSATAMYHITLVTNKRKLILGDIINHEMVLSEIGKIVRKEWLKSFEIRKELFLDTWQMMPNHIHAIVQINNHQINRIEKDPFEGELIRKPRSLSSFIGGFKSAVNSKVDDHIDLHGINIPKYNRHNHFFIPDYSDRIIYNIAEYQRIRNYIINNPKNWLKDKLWNNGDSLSL